MLIATKLLARAERETAREKVKTLPRVERASAKLAAVGRTTLAPTVADRLMNRLRAPATNLTRRETEVLSLVADGLSNQAIGARLHLTEGTAKSHLARIYAKLGTDSTGVPAGCGYRAGVGLGAAVG